MNYQSVRLATAFLFVTSLTFVVFSPVLHNDFLRYDDEIYVYENPYIRSLNSENLKWIFTHSYFKSYTPLALTSHAVDYALFGFNASGHHLTNVLLHSMNTGWVFLLALGVFAIARDREKRMSLLAWLISHTDTPALVGACTAALVFGLHPLRVESVAWVSDRKDLLMGFFAIPAILCYLQYAAGRGQKGSRKWLIGTTLLFVLAILSKAIVIVFPIALLAVDFLSLVKVAEWKRQVLQLVQEKSPLFLVSVLFAYISVVASGTDQIPIAVKDLGTLEKVLLPFYSPTFYLLKFIWPMTLMPMYLAPTLTIEIFYAAITLAVVVISIGLTLHGKPGLFLSLGVFVLFLLPTIFGQSAGIQPWADRYTYLASIGPALLCGWLPILYWPRRRLIFASAVMVIGLLTLISLNQIPRWKDSITLWRHAVESCGQPSVLTMVPLGVAYFHSGELDSAIAWYGRALEVKPESPYAMYNLGVAYIKAGNINRAAEVYEHVVAIDSDYYRAGNNLASIYTSRGQFDKAIGMCRGMLARGYNSADVYYNIGVALEAQGNTQGAIEMFSAALRMVPGHASAHVNLGALAMKQGRITDAVKMYTRGLSFDRTNPVLHYNLGVAQESLGDTAGAVNCYTQAIRFKSDYLDAYINLGNLYARSGLLDNAAIVFNQAIAVGIRSAQIYFGYGVVSEARGNVGEAVEAYRKAIEKDSSYVDAYINLGNLYARSGQMENAEGLYSSALNSGLESQELSSNLAIIRKAIKTGQKGVHSPTAQP